MPTVWYVLAPQNIRNWPARLIDMVDTEAPSTDVVHIITV